MNSLVLGITLGTSTIGNINGTGTAQDRHIATSSIIAEPTINSLVFFLILIPFLFCGARGGLLTSLFHGRFLIAAAQYRA